MIASLTTALVFVLALGSALMAGTFFAFSNFVMPALARLPPAEGISAMQSINRVVLNPLFLGVFLGTAVAAAVLALIALADIGEASSLLIVAAALCYVAGTFGVTVAFNVPLNNALEAADAVSAEAAALWQRYLSEWVFWNTVRTVAPALGLVLLMAALVLRS